MIYTEKTELYKKLVTDIQACPKLSDCNNSKSPKAIQLEKCPFCNEVNLWSYWQGGINNLDADILLVGQDWGNFDDKNYNEIIRSITASEDDSNSITHYPYEKNPTDKNLCRLFDVLGDSFNIKEYNNPKVFFSNFVLCYRKNTRISGGFRQRWARNCSEYFLRLVSIIQPKVIICLGRSVFDAVIKAFGEKPPKGDYNSTISSGAKTLSFNNTTYTIFPVAHCGVFGTNNRKDPETGCSGMKQQEEDWKKIKYYL